MWLVDTANPLVPAYASDTSIFSTQSETGINRQTLAPVEGKTDELGLKSELFDGKPSRYARLAMRRWVDGAVRDYAKAGRQREPEQRHGQAPRGEPVLEPALFCGAEEWECAFELAVMMQGGLLDVGRPANRPKAPPQ